MKKERNTRLAVSKKQINRVSQNDSVFLESKEKFQAFMKLFQWNLNWHREQWFLSIISKEEVKQYVSLIWQTVIDDVNWNDESLVIWNKTDWNQSVLKFNVMTGSIETLNFDYVMKVNNNESIVFTQDERLNPNLFIEKNYWLRNLWRYNLERQSEPFWMNDKGVIVDTEIISLKSHSWDEYIGVLWFENNVIIWFYLIKIQKRLLSNWKQYAIEVEVEIEWKPTKSEWLLKLFSSLK